MRAEYFMAEEIYEEWLKRASSNLYIAKAGRINNVYLEDLCFEAEQSAEKALKALLIFFQGSYPRVHSFNVLLQMLEKHTLIPIEISEVVELSDFSVQTRYPGDYYPISVEEYERTIKIAENVLDWVYEVIEKNKK